MTAFVGIISILINFLPPQTAILILVITGLVTGIAMSKSIKGVVVGSATGLIVANLAESAKSAIAVQNLSGVVGIIAQNMFLLIGALLIYIYANAHGSEAFN
jgi:hypothetical protein